MKKNQDNIVSIEFVGDDDPDATLDRNNKKNDTSKNRKKSRRAKWLFVLLMVALVVFLLAFIAIPAIKASRELPLPTEATLSARFDIVATNDMRKIEGLREVLSSTEGTEQFHHVEMEIEKLREFLEHVDGKAFNEINWEHEYSPFLIRYLSKTFMYNSMREEGLRQCVKEFKTLYDQGVASVNKSKYANTQKETFMRKLYRVPQQTLVKVTDEINILVCERNPDFRQNMYAEAPIVVCLDFSNGIQLGAESPETLKKLLGTKGFKRCFSDLDEFFGLKGGSRWYNQYHWSLEDNWFSCLANSPWERSDYTYDDAIYIAAIVAKHIRQHLDIH